VLVCLSPRALGGAWATAGLRALLPFPSPGLCDSSPVSLSQVPGLGLDGKVGFFHLFFLMAQAVCKLPIAYGGGCKHHLQRGPPASIYSSIETPIRCH